MKRKGHPEEYLLWLVIFDALAVSLGLWIAYFLWFDLRVSLTHSVWGFSQTLEGWTFWRGVETWGWVDYLALWPIMDPIKNWSAADYLMIWPVAMICWTLGLAQWGAYQRGEPIFDLDVGRRLVVGSVMGMALLIAFNFFTRWAEYSRAICLISVALSAFALLLERWLVNVAFIQRLKKRMDSVIIVGSGQMARNLGQAISHEPQHGMALAGYAIRDDKDGEAATDAEDFPAPTGRLEELDQLIVQWRARQVIIADMDLSSDMMARIMMICDGKMVECRAAPNLLGALLSRDNVQYVEGIPVFDIRHTPLQGWNGALKRGFDILISALALLFLSPLLIALALAVKLESRGPVFYKQRRMGLSGETFNIYKFRSMREDAEKDGRPGWTARNDDRRTRVGRLLRETNLDELPQLINVLRGDMSLVGPRPERPFFVKKFRQEIPGYMLRHRVKAGITGWAQVNGLRGDSSIEERITYDLYYIENWSMWLDIKIILKTFVAWRNAY